jgi:histidine triad (HIT) family protein
MAECVFCDIAAGEAPAQIVDEDAETIAFMDINPGARGHALVVPRRHYENLLEIEPDALAATMAAARRLAERIKERLGADGVVLWNSCGATAGQVVMHFHVHVIPTYGETDLSLPTGSPADKSEVAGVAATIRGEE